MKIKTKRLGGICSAVISNAIYYGVSTLNIPFSDPRHLQLQLQQEMSKAFQLITMLEPKNIVRFLLPVGIAFLNENCLVKRILGQ